VNAWSVQDAKARFSEFLDTCITDGPQIVTKRGAGAAVLVPLAKWERLQKAARPSLKEILLAPRPRGDLALPARGRLRRRAPEALV
jgi:antitoxin Phd